LGKVFDWHGCAHARRSIKFNPLILRSLSFAFLRFHFQFLDAKRIESLTGWLVGRKRPARPSVLGRLASRPSRKSGEPLTGWKVVNAPLSSNV
jgi:hypothetical protein